MPVDIGGIIIYGALYLVGLVGLAITAMVCRTKTTVFLFLGYISVPLVFIGMAEFERKKHDQQVAEDEARNLEAYANFCNERRNRPPLVHAKAAIASNAALTVRLEKNHIDQGVMRFPGYSIAKLMWGRHDLENRSGVRYIEDVLTRSVSAESSCEPTLCYSVESMAKSHVPAQRSSYELILGEVGNSTSAPELGRRQQLSKYSARIVNKRTGATLAEDTLYFLSGDTGLKVCPYAPEQLATLIVNVFGLQ